jgi:hypothetical protein
MGQERECRLRYAGRTQAGKAYLETDYLLFRGAERLKLPFQDLTGVSAEAGDLRLDFAGGPAVFEIGNAAAKWAHKILHPPSRLDKLGIKSGMKLRVVGELEPEFLNEAAACGAVVNGSAPDLVFLGAKKPVDLGRIARLAAGMRAGAALWVVYPKGIEDIREIDVIRAGRAAGLKDTKVASFSPTHTALRFAASKTP